MCNGILIVILTEVYRIVSYKLVIWENHKYNSDLDNSMIVKTFIFNFIVNYINLFYYAFWK